MERRSKGLNKRRKIQLDSIIIPPLLQRNLYVIILSVVISRSNSIFRIVLISYHISEQCGSLVLTEKSSKDIVIIKQPTLFNTAISEPAVPSRLKGLNRENENFIAL